jgi:hypothetical protein
LKLFAEGHEKDANRTQELSKKHSEELSKQMQEERKTYKFAMKKIEEANKGVQEFVKSMANQFKQQPALEGAPQQSVRAIGMAPGSQAHYQMPPYFQPYYYQPPPGAQGPAYYPHPYYPTPPHGPQPYYGQPPFDPRHPHPQYAPYPSSGQPQYGQQYRADGAAFSGGPQHEHYTPPRQETPNPELSPEQFSTQK